MSRKKTINKYSIEWNVHHANDMQNNPIDFLYCFQGDSTREHCVRVYKVEFQHPVDENGASLFCDDIFKAEYFILYTLLYDKRFEEYDPYGEKWYMNYTSIDQIAWDFSGAKVFRSFEKLEQMINGRTDQLAYMLSYITESPEEAKEAAGKTRILSLSSHEERYDGCNNCSFRNASLEDIAWYFNEFASSLGILSTKIEKDRICFHIDREGRAVFQIKNDRGYMEHWRENEWREDSKEETLCTVRIDRAFDAVRWLLYKANHELPIKDTLFESWDTIEKKQNNDVRWW